MKQKGMGEASFSQAINSWQYLTSSAKEVVDERVGDAGASAIDTGFDTTAGAGAGAGAVAAESEGDEVHGGFGR